MDSKWSEWDAADYIETEEDAAEFLNAVLELNDPGLLPEALGAIARSRGMTEVAKSTNLGRESLYKALRPGAQPRFETIAKVLSSLGLALRVVPAKQLQ